MSAPKRSWILHVVDSPAPGEMFAEAKDLERMFAPEAGVELVSVSPLATAESPVTRRLRSRAEMNEVSTKTHPDILQRELARARADAYRMAIADVEQLMSDVPDDRELGDLLCSGDELIAYRKRKSAGQLEESEVLLVRALEMLRRFRSST